MILGLTGLIGSGKSTVADLFAALRVRVIDTDLIAHQLSEKDGAAMPLLVNCFGPEILAGDHSLDRKRLRDLVFANDAARQELENILHPLIFAEVKRQLDLPSVAPYTLVVVPLLFRSQKYTQMTQRNIFVDCPYPQLLARLKLRSNLNPEQVDAILARQVERQQQLSMADDIIENNSDLVQLTGQVTKLHQKYLLLR